MNETIKLAHLLLRFMERTNYQQIASPQTVKHVKMNHHVHEAWSAGDNPEDSHGRANVLHSRAFQGTSLFFS